MGPGGQWPPGPTRLPGVTNAELAAPHAVDGAAVHVVQAAPHVDALADLRVHADLQLAAGAFGAHAAGEVVGDREAGFAIELAHQADHAVRRPLGARSRLEGLLHFQAQARARGGAAVGNEVRQVAFDAVDVLDLRAR